MQPIPTARRAEAAYKGGAKSALPYSAAANSCYMKERKMKIIDIRAVGRERTEEEKYRRHLYGDKGAKFSKGKRLCLLGGV